MRRLSRAALLGGMLALVYPASASSQTTLTFEGLYTGVCCGTVPGTYGGFSWTNFGLVDGVRYGSSTQHGVVSPSYVAFNYNGNSTPSTISSATPFDFTSAFLASFLTDGASLTVRGLRSGTELYSRNVTLSSTSTSQYTFDYRNVDQVSFVLNNGPNFLMDNPTFNGSATVTPEPVSMALLGTGLAGLGAARRRRRKQSQDLTA